MEDSSMMMKRDVFLIAAADAARKLGISIKAPKLYERVRIVTPKRTRRGWRLYTLGELERISNALAFRRRGFPIPQIVCLLDAAASELVAAFMAQEQQLISRRAELEDALAALRATRRQLMRLPRLAA
jgi:DNA-binding transcriptional MerR regulator